MQRMSGIATSTHEYVSQLKGLKTKILDTRKTTPGFRFLEKEAIRIGGGMNHRMGLYDMIMLKDNHIDYAGGIVNAIQKTREYLKKNNLNIKVEIEARSLDDIRTILRTGGIDRIMLDNFSISETLSAVKEIAGRYETESSGGINISTIRAYSECGVDFISVGALTHHIKSLDMSLKAI
jgi:nicotinate-nucleotide pyrophosphorylase (carboxylating)